MDDTDAFDDPVRRPTGTRPLLGQTVLVVEYSHYACDALRLLCLRSGARIRWADSLKSARRHLQIYRPTVLIVDVGLPDGSGADLIKEAANTSPRVQVILGMSGDAVSEELAIAAGADGFLAKPILSLAQFQTAILTRLPTGWRPIGPHAVSDETVCPDPIAYRDDMAHVAEVLTQGADDRILSFVAQFLTGVAHSDRDRDLDLEEAALSLTREQAAGRPVGSDAARLAGLVQDRLHGSAMAVAG